MTLAVTHLRRTLDPDTLVVVLDSNDATCLPCDRDLRTEFLKLGHDIVFGGTCTAFPDQSMGGWYPSPPEKPASLRRCVQPQTGSEDSPAHTKRVVWCLSFFVAARQTLSLSRTWQSLAHASIYNPTC